MTLNLSNKLSSVYVLVIVVEYGWVQEISSGEERSSMIIMTATPAQLPPADLSLVHQDTRNTWTPRTDTTVT